MSTLERYMKCGVGSAAIAASEWPMSAPTAVFTYEQIKRLGRLSDAQPPDDLRRC